MTDDQPRDEAFRRGQPTIEEYRAMGPEGREFVLRAHLEKIRADLAGCMDRIRYIREVEMGPEEFDRRMAADDPEDPEHRLFRLMRWYIASWEHLGRTGPPPRPEDLPPAWEED